MKMDKEFLLKNKFWVALAGSGALTLLALFMLLVVAPKKISALEKAKKEKWDEFTKVTDIKNDRFVEEARKKADREKVRETEVWVGAYGGQKDVVTFPPAFTTEFDVNNGLYAIEVTVHPKDAKPADLPADEPKDEAPAKAAPKDGKDANPLAGLNVQSSAGRFTGRLQEFDAEWIAVADRDKGPPKKFYKTPNVKVSLPGGTAGGDEKDKDKGPGTAFADLAKSTGALVTVAFERGRYFGDPWTLEQRRVYAESYKSQLHGVLDEAQPLNELGQTLVQFRGWPYDKKALPEPSSRFFHYVAAEGKQGVWDLADKDISEEIWLAQEDVWVYRELFRLVKKANDYVANFEPVRDAKGKTVPGLFSNPYWQLELKLLAPKQLQVKITNRLSRPQRIDTTRFLIKADPKGPLQLIPRLDGEPLAPAGAKDDKGVPRDTAEKTLDLTFTAKGIAGVRQMLTWETAAVKRIDQVALGTVGADEWAHSHRSSHQALRPLKKKEAETKPEEGAEKQPQDQGGMKGSGGMKGAPQGGGATAEIPRTPNGLASDRYLDVTPQARRIPVGIVLIVDQAHVARVQTAFADSPLRFLTTQVMLHRYPQSVRPSNAGAPAASDPSTPVAGVGPMGPMGSNFPGGGFGSMGSKGAPGVPPGMQKAGGFNPTGRGIPGLEGQPGASPYGGGTPSPGGADEPESNAELVIYGIVALYERFPPRPGGSTPPPDSAQPKQ